MTATIRKALFTSACVLCASTVHGQDPKVKAIEAPKERVKVLDKVRTEVNVIPLKYSDATTAARTVGDVFRNTQGRENVNAIRITPDERSNSLIVMASEADFLAIRNLVANLDKELPSSQDNDTHRMRVIQLRNQPDDALDRTIKLLSAADGEQYSIDRLRRQIVLVASAGTSKNIDDFIARWDVAPPATVAPLGGDVQVRVVWISNNNDEESKSRSLPEDLKPLIPAFRKVGIDKPFAAATYLVATTPNTEFSTVGAMFGIGTSLRINGQYGDRKSSSILSISIRDVAQEDKVIDINSELTAPLGHLIVLCATTVGAAQIQMAFVVQVTRPDSFNAAAQP